MSKLIDLTGRVFERLTVLRRAESGKWLVACECGTTKEVDGRSLRQGKTRSCKCLYREKWRGANNPKWVGGRFITAGGYIGLYHNGERTTEHRLVMEQAIGRKLFPGESVHHKNGDRRDNRIENLELWSSPQPSGQRPHDLVAWATAILEQYAPERLAGRRGAVA